jgi:hydroxymethylpyrimidine/phosphomethylpyrimidine kinase
LFRAPRRKLNGHGTGCTLASLIAARLALGEPSALAASNAIAAFRLALANGATVGRGKVWVPYPLGPEALA